MLRKRNLHPSTQGSDGADTPFSERIVQGSAQHSIITMIQISNRTRNIKKHQTRNVLMKLCFGVWPSWQLHSIFWFSPMTLGKTRTTAGKDCRHRERLRTSGKTEHDKWERLVANIMTSQNIQKCKRDGQHETPRSSSRGEKSALSSRELRFAKRLERARQEQACDKKFDTAISSQTEPRYRCM